MKLRTAAAAAACLTALAMPAAAGAADPLPPGAADVGQPRVRRPHRPDAAGITEGKFDRVARRRHPRRHRAASASRPTTSAIPANPVLLDTFMPPGDVKPSNGYWQDEDMELDTSAT